MRSTTDSLAAAARQHVDLLGGLGLSPKPLEGLDRPGLDLAKAMQFEHLTEAIDHVGLDEAFGGSPFGEA